jgi:protein SCO1
MALSVATTACRALKNSIFILTCNALIPLGCQPETKQEPDRLPFYNTADFDAEWIDSRDPAYAKIHTIAPFSLTNQAGYTITTDSLAGHIYVANFFFSICPSVCPTMMGNLKTVQDSFARNPRIKLVSFSVMPWADSVSRLRQYGKVRGINPAKWHLLTGQKEEIYTLGRTSYFAEKGLGLQKNATEFLHTESMLLIDGQGRIRGIYNATQKLDIERVTEDIYTLLKE